MDIEIVEAVSQGDFAAARTLFEEYADGIKVDLCFQNFSAELDRLPTMYGSPDGALLLARTGGGDAGCVGLRRLRDDVCEMKRLYVRPPFRGQELGRRLATEIAAKARHLGYRKMVLDTLASMQAARALYVSMGFRPAEAYYANPLPDVRYLSLDLQSALR